MVCANKEARFVRELDLFRNKLGIRSDRQARYSIAAQNELRSNADKFLVEPPASRDHSARDHDPRGECEGR